MLQMRRYLSGLLHIRINTQAEQSRQIGGMAMHLQRETPLILDSLEARMVMQMRNITPTARAHIFEVLSAVEKEMPLHRVTQGLQLVCSSRTH